MGRHSKQDVHSYPMPSSRRRMICFGCRQTFFNSHDIIRKVGISNSRNRFGNTVTDSSRCWHEW